MCATKHMTKQRSRSVDHLASLGKCSVPGWGGCRGSAGRPGAGWPAPAAKQLTRIGRYRDMQLAEPTRWAEGVAAGAAACGEWCDPSASEPADDSAAHFQIDCKSTREAGASWNEVTGGYDEARCRAALPEPHSWFCQRCTASSASSIAIQSEHAYRSRLGLFLLQILKCFNNSDTLPFGSFFTQKCCARGLHL